MFKKSLNIASIRWTKSGNLFDEINFISDDNGASWQEENNSNGANGEFFDIENNKLWILSKGELKSKSLE